MAYQLEKRSLSITTQYFQGLTQLPHIHPHLEMVYLTEGCSTAMVDYHNFPMEKGDLFLSFPNQIHFYHDSVPTAGYLFIFSPDFFKELNEIFQKKIPSSPVIKGELLPPDILTLLEQILVKNNADTFLGKITSKGYLLALLGEILQAMTLVPKVSGNDSIKNILTYCSEHYMEPLCLDQLSRELHLSKYYISHMFKERMNISFPDFINGLRIEHACTLLERSSDITEAAFSSGFSSIRTFNRSFIKNMGMAPREFRKMEGRT